LKAWFNDVTLTANGYSTRLQPAQTGKLLKQTTHVPVTACTDRRCLEIYHRALPSLRAGWALCTLQEH